MTVQNKVALVTGAGQGIASFFAGPDSDHVTGRVLLVDGGMLYN